MSVFIDQPSTTRAKTGDFPRHQLQGVLWSGLEPGLNRRIDLVEIEALAPLDPDTLHLGQDRLISDVGRLELEDLGGVGEELAADIVSTVIFGGVFMSTLGSTVPTTGSAAFPQREIGVIL